MGNEGDRWSGRKARSLDLSRPTFPWSPAPSAGEIRDKIRDIIAERREIPRERIGDTTDLVEELGLG